MKIPSRIIPSLVAAIIGVLVWLPLTAANGAFDRSANDVWTLWYWIGYPLLVILSFAIGHRAARITWKHGPIAVFSSYFGALLLVPHTGNMLPFELLWMAVLAIPAALLERLGSKMAAESNRPAHIPTGAHEQEETP